MEVVLKMKMPMTQQEIADAFWAGVGLEVEPATIRIFRDLVFIPFTSSAMADFCNRIRSIPTSCLSLVWVGGGL